MPSQLYDFAAKSRKHDVTFISRYKGDLPSVSSQPCALPPISHLTTRPTHSSRRGVLRRQLPKCQVPGEGGKLYVNSCACAIEQIVMSGERKCLHCRDWHAQTEPQSTLVHVKPVAFTGGGGAGDGGLVMGSWWWGRWCILYTSPGLLKYTYVIQTPSSAHPLIIHFKLKQRYTMFLGLINTKYCELHYKTSQIIPIFKDSFFSGYTSMKGHINCMLHTSLFHVWLSPCHID